MLGCLLSPLYIRVGVILQEKTERDSMISRTRSGSSCRNVVTIPAGFLFVFALFSEPSSVHPPLDNIIIMATSWGWGVSFFPLHW